MQNSNNKRKNHTLHFTLHTSQKGITLIALIITIIVMLILVGVTISVVLNGGLFGKGEKAAFQTKASTVKEQLELEKALRTMDNGGKKLEDYSGITVGKLQGLDEKTKEEFGNKLVVNQNGDICYDPTNVTDAEEIEWLKEIGINPYEGEKKEEFYEVAYVANSAWNSSNSITIYLLDNGICYIKENGEERANKYSKNDNLIELFYCTYSLSEDYKTLELEQGSSGYQIFTRNENDRYEYSKNLAQHPTYKIYINAFYEDEAGNIIITTDTEVKGEGTFEQLLSYGATVSEDGKTISSPEGDIYTLVE